MDSMPRKEIRDLDIPKQIETRIERRERKKKPKMKVSGKRVFQLKKLLKK